MNRFLLLVAVALAATSCLKQEFGEENSQTPALIKFSTYAASTSATKTSDVTSANLTGDVGVYAIVSTATSFSDLKIPNTELSGVVSQSDAYVGNNDAVDSDGDYVEDFSDVITGQWSASASYYWPSDSSISYDFYAYYPFTDVADKAGYITSDGVLTDGDAQFEIAETAEGQVDILAGGALEQRESSDSEVMLTLNHMLAKVDFQIGLKSEVEASAITLIIEDIQLRNILHTHSGLDLNGAANDDSAELLVNTTASDTTTSDKYIYGAAQTSGALFDMYAVPTTYITGYDDAGNAIEGEYLGAVTYNEVNGYWVLKDATIYSVKDDANNMLVTLGGRNQTTSYYDIDAASTDAFKMLPQVLTDDTQYDQQVVLWYTVMQSGSYIAQSSTSGYAIDLRTNEVPEWEAGHHYIYRIIFNAEYGGIAEYEGDLITFDVMVNDWVEPVYEYVPEDGITYTVYSDN